MALIENFAECIRQGKAAGDRVDGLKAYEMVVRHAPLHSGEGKNSASLSTKKDGYIMLIRSTSPACPSRSPGSSSS
jgi:hypothetical protein